MFSFNDLFQWERFVTPSIIKLFFWLVVGATLLFGLAGIVSALGMFTTSPVRSIVTLLVSLFGMVAGVIFARVVAEFVLMIFRINEHVSAIRNRDET